MGESGVILPADSTGKALRSQSVTTAFTTGTGGTVHQQVVTLADSAGNLLGTAAAAVPTTSPDAVVTGTITATSGVAASAAGAFTSTALAASSWVAVTVSGTGVLGVGISGNASANTVVFEGTYDGTNWTPINAVVSGTGVQVSSTAAATFGGRINAGGYSSIRVRSVAAWTASTVTVTLRANANSTLTTMAEPLPSGVNQIGALTPSALAVTAVSTAAGAITATLPAVAGQFHYITSIFIQRYATAALTAAATPITVTSTNLPGSLAWAFDTAGAIGVSQVQQLTPTPNPIKSSVVNTATTIVAPATTGVLWRITVTYYTAA